MNFVVSTLVCCIDSFVFSPSDSINKHFRNLGVQSYARKIVITNIFVFHAYRSLKHLFWEHFTNIPNNFLLVKILIFYISHVTGIILDVSELFEMFDQESCRRSRELKMTAKKCYGATINFIKNG